MANRNQGGLAGAPSSGGEGQNRFSDLPAGAESPFTGSYDQTIHPRNASVPPEVAGLAAAQDLEGCPRALPGFNDADTSQYSETPAHTIPDEGGAKLGKGSSKLFFPL